MKPLFLKPIILYILFFLSYTIHAQNLNEMEIYQLKELHINFEKVNLTDYNTQLNLQSILDLDRTRKTNKTFAIIFTSLSALSLILGGAIISKKNESIIAQALGDVILTGGIIFSGISIPFWVSSGKRKKQRDRLIKLF